MRGCRIDLIGEERPLEGGFLIPLVEARVPANEGWVCCRACKDRDVTAVCVKLLVNPGRIPRARGVQSSSSSSSSEKDADSGLFLF
jgi:hypothetical protein